MTDADRQEGRGLERIFLRELREALSAARVARAGLQANSVAGWDELRRFFHRLAGSAAVGSRPLLGRLAAACETLCDLVVAGELQSGPRVWRALDQGLSGAGEALVEEERLPEEPLEAAELRSLVAGDPAGQKVLLVDDDLTSSRQAVDTLRQAGYAVTHVAESDRALDAIFVERPDLVVLDVVMPGIDGFTLCEKIRAQSALALLPVLFLTRRGDVVQRVRGLEVGGNDYISKPFEPSELVARVRSHLGRLATLQEMAIRDGLTRCYNQKYFKGRLEQELARARRYQSGLSVALVDVDFFKRINDEHGHIAGDAVLAHLSSLIAAAVRSTDVVARYGGEEFGLLLVQAAAPEAEIIMGRMRQRIESHVFSAVGGEGRSPPQLAPATDGQQRSIAAADGPMLKVTVSIGIAEACANDGPAALLGRADRALYAAKAAGRNQVRLAPRLGDT